MIKLIKEIEAKSDEMIFIGYSSTSKAFRVYNRSTRAITESINVSFDEKGEMASESSRSEPVLTGVRVSDQLHSSAIQSDQQSDPSNFQTDLDILFENFTMNTLMLLTSLLLFQVLMLICLSKFPTIQQKFLRIQHLTQIHPL